jgi:hypothetical protein
VKKASRSLSEADSPANRGDTWLTGLLHVFAANSRWKDHLCANLKWCT